MMARKHLNRIAGLALVLGAVGFALHLALRSFVTAGVEPSVFARQSEWISINALGALGAIVVLLALPALYARIGATSGRLGLIGVVLISVAWLFFGVFLSLYGLLILPWLAEHAPALVAASPPPTGFALAFLAALLAWCAGTVLFGIPFIRRRVAPRWVGYVLVVSALWMVVGNLVLAPRGPAANVGINLLSNLGPVLLLVALGQLGQKMWREAG